MYESRYATREDLDAAMRFGCGYPMGPLALLDLIGLDTAYEILDTMYKQGRDRLHAPSPIIKQMVSAGLLGPQERSGLLHLRRGRARPQVVADAQTPAGGPPAGVSLRPVASVGVVGSGTMATGIIEVFAKAGYAVTFVARSEEKVAGVLTALGRSCARAVEKGRMEQEAADALLGRVAGATGREALADVDLVVEAIAEDLAVKQDALPRPRPDLQAGRHPRHDHVVAADHRLRQGHRPAAGRHRDALLQPGADHEAGRGRAHRVDRRRTSPPRCRTSAPRSARWP